MIAARLLLQNSSKVNKFVVCQVFKTEINSGGSRLLQSKVLRSYFVNRTYYQNAFRRSYQNPQKLQPNLLILRRFRTRLDIKERELRHPKDDTSIVFAKYGLYSIAAIGALYAALGISEACKNFIKDKRISLNSSSSTNLKIYINERPIDRNVLNLFALNLIVFGMWKVPSLRPLMAKYFCLSALAVQRNFPSFIGSGFSHKLFLHLLVNMYVLKSFTQPWDSNERLQNVKKKELFMPFYLSAAIASSLFSFGIKLITKSHIPSLGASGAIMALLAYGCTKYPNSQLSIVFLPQWNFSASSGLIGIGVFDGVGLATMLLRNYISFQSPFDHAGHFGGLLFGVWYALYGEEKFLKWTSYWRDWWSQYLEKNVKTPNR